MSISIKYTSVNSFSGSSPHEEVFLKKIQRKQLIKWLSTSLSITVSSDYVIT